MSCPWSCCMHVVMHACVFRFPLDKRPCLLCGAVFSLQQCEDLEDTASLQHLFRIMRSMVMLNDTQVSESA